MKLSKLLRIIKEELEYFYDDEQGMADRYFEKNYGTQTTTMNPEVKINAELVGYVDKVWGGASARIPVYKNPPNLVGFAASARGILLNNGDLYLASTDNALHTNILNMLGQKGIVPISKTIGYEELFPNEFVAVIRVGNTEVFAQSSAYHSFPEHYKEIFAIGTQKQPFRFIAYPMGDNIDELESPLDPMNQYSNIPPGHDANILYEESDDIYGDKNRGILKRTGEEFWIGTVNVYDGEIEEVHTYEEARDNDFHHSFYFSQSQIEKMTNGECMIFWINADGIQAEWTMGKASPDIINKIKEQITFNMKADKTNNFVKSVLKEFLVENTDIPIIEITPVEQDERSGKKQVNAYHVNYQKNVDGNLIEIEGTLNPFHTGRAVEYGFEPSYFDDANVEAYWDANWEIIEDEIRDKFYTLKY